MSVTRLSKPLHGQNRRDYLACGLVQRFGKTAYVREAEVLCPEQRPVLQGTALPIEL